MNVDELKSMIRNQVAGTDGVIRNLLPLYADRDALGTVLDVLVEPYRGKVDYVCSPESLGFILGSMLANELKTGFVAIRKDRPLSGNVEDIAIASYIDHRNHVATLSVDRKLLPEGSRILLVDDWVETAATVYSCMNILEDLGCTVVGIAAIGVSYNDATRDLIDSKLVKTVVSDR